MTDDKQPAVKRRGIATSLRVSPAALSLWDQLAEREGLNRTAYLETTLRRIAGEKGITAEVPAGPEEDAE